jgi:hypothetical protein
MSLLEKYKLDPVRAVNYFKENFSNLNILSRSTFRNIDFENGFFYTFLNKGLDNKTLHDFEGGFVADNARSETIKYILNLFKKNKEYTCVVDHFNAKYELSKKHSVYQKLGVEIEKELYFIIENREASEEIIDECLRASDTIWHSLAIITKGISNRRADKTLTNEDCSRITQEALFIIVLAYDSESYIIWERD